MSDTNYNGYTNYETWVISCWIQNDEYLNNELMAEMATEAFSQASDFTEHYCDTREKYAAQLMAETLKEWVEEQQEELKIEGFFANLLNSAISEVDWIDMAENFIDGIEADEKAEILASELA